MIKKFGRKQADYYWERRNDLNKERSDIWSTCKEINKKCDLFFEKRGIKVFKY
jgi:hypothetical protein